ncbi:MAG: hypothetical protein Q9218_005129 [Villophora microphyllina]
MVPLRQRQASKHFVLPVPSVDGDQIAIIADADLSIRSSANGHIIQSYILPPGFSHSCRFIRWYPATRAKGSTTGSDGHVTGHAAGGLSRLLLADDARIMIYDVTKTQVYAEITGATTLTKLAGIEFGYTLDEVMVFSDFGWKLQIWSLMTKRAIEIKDPKSVTSSYSYRPGTGHLALLTRPAAHDMLLIMAPGCYEVLATWELATVDARGVRYSPDGNWLVVWDAASAGCRVLFLTADGHHFKTYSMPQHELNLGVSCVQWSPLGDCLAIGDYGGDVTVLPKNTVRIDTLLDGFTTAKALQFVPRFRFSHAPTIDIPDGTVWQEEIGPSLGRAYAETGQAAVPPSQDSFAASKEKMMGLGPMKFNIDGTLLASRSSATPSTLWIHSLKTGRALTALIHHSPITSVRWHHTIHDLLLVQCTTPEPRVYLWRASWSTPRVHNLPLKAPVGHMRACWLSSDERSIQFVLSNTNETAIERLTLDGEEVGRQENGEDLGPEAMFDEGNSLDLSPVKIPGDGTQTNGTPGQGLATQLGHSLDVDDTFHFRR